MPSAGMHVYTVQCAKKKPHSPTLCLYIHVCIYTYYNVVCDEHSEMTSHRALLQMQQTSGVTSSQQGSAHQLILTSPQGEMSQGNSSKGTVVATS